MPKIPDRLWPTIRVIWLTIIAASIIANVVGGMRFYERQSLRPFSHLGLGWTAIDGKVTLMSGSTKEAVREGIKEGQRIVAIDGRPISDNLADIDAIQQALVRPEGATITLTTVDNKGVRANHRLTRLEANMDEATSVTGLSSRTYQIIDSATALLPAFALLTAAALLFRSRRKETIVVLLACTFALMASSTAAANLAYTNQTLIFVLNRLLSPLWVFGLFLAIVVFPDGAVRGKLAKLSIVLVIVALALDQSPWRDFFQPVLLLSAALPLVVLWRRRQSLANDQSQLQVRAAMFGLLTGFGMIFVGMILWLIGGADRSHTAFAILVNLASQIAFALGMIVMAMGLVVSILRYRLYDVDTIISRSAAYGAMTVGFIAVFAGVEKLAEIASEEYFGEEMRMISGAGAAAIAAAIIAPMHNRIHHWAERKFHSTLQLLRVELPAVVDDLRETATLKELGDAVVTRLSNGVRATGCELRVGGSVVANSGHDCSTYEYAVPLTAAGSGSPVGELVLGPRPDGSGYNKDEREALSAFSSPIGRAVDVVCRREAKEQALDDRIARLERAIAKATGMKKGASGK
ncbi:hypothetical protein [Sphingomonas jaspsi]|uniref:hypothetical protein n=1 Tax=Sphingomonas jaspsi TaxID=392409 RepID=UPI0012EB2977|nr:hypothetical protein [Sphingomonas jaspsi]